MLKLFGMLGFMILSSFAVDHFTKQFLVSKKEEIQGIKEVLTDGGIDRMPTFTDKLQAYSEKVNPFQESAAENEKEKGYEATLILKHECLAKKWPSQSAVQKYVQRSTSQKLQPDETVSVDVRLTDYEEYKRLKAAVAKDVCISSYVLHDQKPN